MIIKGNIFYNKFNILIYLLFLLAKDITELEDES